MCVWVCCAVHDAEPTHDTIPVPEAEEMSVRFAVHDPELPRSGYVEQQGSR